MRKGFTLIELLAVIVIVGVIGVITVPMAMGSIESTRKSAFEAGIQSVLEAAVAYVTRVEETGEIPEGGIKVEDLSEELKNEKYISGVILKNSDGSITVEGISDGEFCASGTKNNLRVIKGSCSDLDNTPPTLKVMLNKRTSNSITIVANGQDATSGIYGYAYSVDGVNYSEITSNNIYTVSGLKRNETVKIYVRVYNTVYDETNSEENLSYSMTEEVVEYTTLNIEKPEFKISTSENSASTVKIVEIIYPENTEGYEYSYILNGKEEKVSETSTRITMLENGTIIARIKTKNEVIENKLEIAGLDNTGPVGNIVYKETWETSKKITIEVSYEQTGLPSEPYSYDGGITWTSSNEKVYVNRENLTGKIQVRDLLGNITKELTVNGKEVEEIEIGYIDNERPTCSLKIISGTEGQSGWYISDVGIDYDWMKDTANHCKNNTCEEREPGSGIKTYSIDKPKVTENGKIKVIGTVEDHVGNIGTCEIEVKRDTKRPEAPTVIASDNKTSSNWHNADYILTFTGSTSESGIRYEYSTDGKNYTTVTSINVTEETTSKMYYVRGCNGAGICGEATRYESKLDKQTPSAPTIKASDNKTSGAWHDANFIITFTGSSSISGVTYQYSTNGSNYTNGSSVSISTDVNGTTYYVRACSGAGKCSSTTNYVVRLDKTRPTLNVNLDSGSYNENRTITITAADNISGIQAISYQVYLNGSLYSSNSNYKSSTLSLNLNTSGKWQVYVKTVNNANLWNNNNWTIYTYYIKPCDSTYYVASNGYWGSCSVDCGGGTKYYYETRTYYSNYNGQYCSTSSNVNTGTTQNCNTESCEDDEDCCDDCSCRAGTYCGHYCDDQGYDDDGNWVCWGDYVPHC